MLPLPPPELPHIQGDALGGGAIPATSTTWIKTTLSDPTGDNRDPDRERLSTGRGWGGGEGFSPFLIP